MLKRIFDIIFAVLFLLFLWPVYIIVAIIIKFTSKGTIIYKANRVGKDGKIFTCFKFRSMHENSGSVHITTLKNDTRIYPFGRILRKSKIDEFPQIFNILLGDMSVVGPRPEDEENAKRIYVNNYKELLTVKPGLTSTGSLYDYTHGENYEDEESYEKEFLKKKLDLELFYVRNRSVTYDLELIVRTAAIILCVLLGRKEFEEPKELLIVDSKEKELQEV